MASPDTKNLSACIHFPVHEIRAGLGVLRGEVVRRHHQKKKKKSSKIKGVSEDSGTVFI